jgi:cytochrome P450
MLQDLTDPRLSALDARIQGKPLSAEQKRAHATLLIQAGADTTGTSLGSTLRFVATHPAAKAKAVEEIQRIDAEGKLSHPILYEETANYLPYTLACIKESLRLHPPASNLFARVSGKQVQYIDGHYVPSGVEVTSNAYVVQRDPELYAPDPHAFRPDRWLEDKDRAHELETMSFVFGIGARVCLGKEIALMELYKLIPEVCRCSQPAS